MTDATVTSDTDPYEICRDHAREPVGPPPLEAAAALIGEARALYHRRHSSETKMLSKSGNITRMLRLMSLEELYPAEVGRRWHADGSVSTGADAATTYMLAERLDLMFEIIADSPQRPVVEIAALVCLEQELEERWSRSLPTRVKALLDAAEQTRHMVLPLLALLARLTPARAEQHYEELRTARFQDKRMRLVELVILLDTYEDSPGFEAIVESTFEAIFDGTTPEGKFKLIRRFLDEIRRRRVLERHLDRWRLLLEPLTLQNYQNMQVLELIVEMALELRDDQARPYVLFYIDSALELGRPEAITLAVMDFARDAGTRDFVARLYPLTELTTGLLFERPSRLANRAKRAVDAIIEREGLNAASGGLSVAEGSGGELSLVHASEGALTVSADEAVAPRAAGALTHASSPAGLDRRVVIAAVLVVVLLAAALAMMALL